MKMSMQPVALLFAVPILSVAADEAISEEEALELIYGDSTTVSIATGTAQPVNKAPAVASVITAADIKAMGATDIDEVLETVPGLHVAHSYLGYAPIYTFRGIYSRFNPQVLMLINGVPITTSYTGDRNLSWGGMPVQAVSRIEVVRGPGSAVYGADAFAGVINIITKTKEDINGTEVGGRVGSFDTYDGWAMYGGEWKGFDVAAMVEYHNTNGQNSIIDADAQSQFDRSFGTQASLAPGPVNLSRDNLDARVDLSRGHWRFRGGLQHRDNYGSGAGVVQALDTVTMFGSDRWNADLTYHNAEFAEDWDVTAQLSYLDSDQHNTAAFPPGARLPIGANGLIDFANPVQTVTFANGFRGTPENWERHARASVSAVYRGFSAHTLRLGGGFNYDNLYRVRESKNFGPDPVTGTPIPFLPGTPMLDVSNTPLVYLPAVDRKVRYFLLQDEWQFARDWQLTAGLRYDNYSDFGDTLNPRGALVWETRYDLTTKLIYGRAFRAPAFIELYNINNPGANGNPSLKPETMDSLELAFDYRPFQDVRLGLNFFKYWWKDLIQFVPDAGGTTITAQNAGAQTGHGGELEAEWKVFDDLSLIGNYSYQKSIDEKLNHDAGYAPHHQLYARAEWEFLPDWQLVPQLKWVGERDRPAGDTRLPLSDYTWVDMTLRRKNVLDHVEVAFSVRNLLGVDAREPTPAGTPSAAIPYDLPLAGRSFYGEVRFNF